MKKFRETICFFFFEKIFRFFFQVLESFWIIDVLENFPDFPEAFQKFADEDLIICTKNRENF